jgi:chlorite dismutase
MTATTNVTEESKHGHQQQTQSIEEMREGRQFLKYTFFKLMPGWRATTEDERERGKSELARILDRNSKKMILKSFSLIGTRADTDFMLWTISERLEDFQELISQIMKSSMGKHLELKYSYLSMTRKSEYIREHRHPGQEGDSLKKVPGNARYLFVYPFVKKREWYGLPAEERQRIMLDHVRTGHKYSTVKINTSYSFGLDDPEFVLSFESDYPSDFLELVMELRGTEASKFTALETPIFTCVSVPAKELMDMI